MPKLKTLSINVESRNTKMKREAMELQSESSDHSIHGRTTKLVPQHSRKSDSVGASSSSETSSSDEPQRVVSVPTLLSTTGSQPVKKRMRKAESSILLTKKHAPLGSTASTTALCNTDTFSCQAVRPEAFLDSLMLKLGLPSSSIKVSTKEFLPISAQQHPSYAQAAMAARNEDLNTLKRLHEEGENLQCSNAFGESIIHIVCRRGNDKLLRFLLHDANVTVRIQDDLGRTPLHDAAWTDKPNFEVVRLLLTEAPELLFVRDKRGNSAFGYIPSQNWTVWNKFLAENSELYRSHFADERS